MQVTHYFTASLTAPAPAVLYAVKGDGARMAVARLMAGAEPWTVPEGVMAGVSYTLPDKTPGYYDRLEGGAPACMIAGNLVSAVIAPVLTGQAGAVKASIVLRDADGDQVATFPFQLRVEPAPGIVDAEGVPAMGSGFEGKLFYGGPGGALTALALGDGVRVETTEDGTLALVAEGGSGGGGGIDEEKDPTVPAWAKQPQKPTYTAQEVGALPAGTKIPGKTSELTNDAGFVNKAVNDLTNYYTRQQTQELIAAIPRFRVTVVQQLPAAGEELVLYLVPFATAEGQYLEYIWVDGRWEIIGSQRVDLTGYATEEWVQEYVEEHSGGNADQTEPAVEDIPKVFFVGTAPTTKAQDELPLTMEYISKTKRIFSYVTLKVQGDSSASYPKKNFNLKMFEDADRTEKLKCTFRDWSKTHKYCLKANWIDHTHARNVVNGRLWGQVARSRADYDSYPVEYKESANCGTVNGFPVKVYLNGVYQGIYTWNIRKDSSMFNMDDESGIHSALIADGVNAITAWRELPTIGGGDWTDELNDTVPGAVKTSFQNAYSFVINSTDDEFRANIGNYFYLSSLIDYYIFIYSTLMFGGLAKSQTMLTYDAQKYLANIYDMDTTWALYWNGKSFVSVTMACPEGYEHTAGYNLLYERLVKLFPNEIKTRYAELRGSVLSDANIINEFERFMDVIGNDLYAEDFAETTANGAFTEIPSSATNNLQKLRDIIVRRMKYCDENIPLIGTEEPDEEIPATGITLSASVLTFTDSATQTITATVEPSNTTDKVVWSSSTDDVVTVTNGVVRPISNGSATITAKAGSVSAACEVTVNVAELVVLTGISATYTGGEVTKGTALTDLTGITVTATYSDGSTAEVTDYVLSGAIAVGQNTITVTYEGMTTTFVVTGTEIDYGDALYPLDNGTWTNGNGTLSAEVTNGNHLKVTNTGTTPMVGIFINITDVISSSDGVNNHATEFTLSAGDVVKYAVSGSDGAINSKQSFGWRKANTNTAITELAINNTGNVSSFEREFALSADYDVGSMFVYGTFPAGTTYEYDFSLIVNNQRYI